jgi:hypothetical protein
MQSWENGKNIKEKIGRNELIEIVIFYVGGLLNLELLNFLQKKLLIGSQISISLK